MNARLRDNEPLQGAATRQVEQRTRDAVRTTDDTIACEVPVALHYNNAPFAVLMATPCDLADLALGFSLSEGIVNADDDWQLDTIDEGLDGITIHMRIPTPRETHWPSAAGSCPVMAAAGSAAVHRLTPCCACQRRYRENQHAGTAGQLRRTRAHAGQQGDYRRPASA